jgi:hypothetical protein
MLNQYKKAGTGSKPVPAQQKVIAVPILLNSEARAEPQEAKMPSVLAWATASFRLWTPSLP